MERVNLVNSSGEMRKANVLRHTADDHADLHMQIAIVVVLDEQNRVLVHRRALTKAVNPGDIDHICGAVMAEETPVQAAAREAAEEAGVELQAIRLIAEGVNEYGRYRYLFTARAHGEPVVVDEREVAWVGFMHLDALRALHLENAGEGFVDGFLQDIERVVETLQ